MWLFLEPALVREGHPQCDAQAWEDASVPQLSASVSSWCLCLGLHRHGCHHYPPPFYKATGSTEMICGAKDGWPSPSAFLQLSSAKMDCDMFLVHVKHWPNFPCRATSQKQASPRLPFGRTLAMGHSG